MSTNKTGNYGLHAWVLEDDFLLQEINENFAAIDGALGGKAEVVTGTCTGDGADSQLIDLGFTPRAVLLVGKEGYMGADYKGYGGLALPGFPVEHTAGTVLTVVDNGFTIRSHHVSGRSYSVDANNSSRLSFYLALR